MFVWYHDYLLIYFVPAFCGSAYNKGDYDQLHATLSDFCCTFLNSSPEANSVGANWNHFTQAISAAIDECIPSKLTSNRNKRPAWLNAPVRKLIRNRDHLAKVAKKTRLTIDRDRYSKARNKASTAIEAGYRGCTDTSELRHFGPKTFRHCVFGAEVSQIFALVPKCPLHQCWSVSDSSALKCMRHFGPRIKRCFNCRHCVKKCRPTLYSVL